MTICQLFWSAISKTMSWYYKSPQLTATFGNPCSSSSRWEDEKRKFWAKSATKKESKNSKFPNLLDRFFTTIRKPTSHWETNLSKVNNFPANYFESSFLMTSSFFLKLWGEKNQRFKILRRHFEKIFDAILENSPSQFWILSEKKKK